jgi:uncharacterized membrane protein
MSSNPKSTFQIAGHPIHPMIIPFPVAFFVSAFVTDLLFLAGYGNGLATGSKWLLGAGLIMAALAAVAGLIDFFGEPRIRALSEAWMHMIGNVIVVVLELVNFFLRYGEQPPTVSSLGVLISGVAAVLLIFNGWMGWQMVYQHRVGIADAQD